MSRLAALCPCLVLYTVGLVAPGCAGSPTVNIARDVMPPPAPTAPVEVLLRCDRFDYVPYATVWNPSAGARTCHMGRDEGEEATAVGAFEERRIEPRAVPCFPSERCVAEVHALLECDDTPDDRDPAAAIARLEDPAAEVRTEALKALAALGPRGRSAVDAIVARARVEPDDTALFHTADALIAILGAEAAGPLTDALAIRTDEAGRRRLAGSAAGLGEAARSLIAPRLDDERIVSAFNLAELVDIDLDVARVHLRAGLGAPDTNDRLTAMRALDGYLVKRPDDHALTQIAIETITTSPDKKLRYDAADALAVVPTAASVAALVQALGDPDRSVVFNAAGALGRLALSSPTARALVSAEAVDALVALLPTDDRTLKWNTTMALGRIGKDTPRVRAALADAAAGDDPRVAVIATVALAQVAGRVEDDALLRAALASPEPRLVGLTLTRLLEAGPLAAGLADAVLALLPASASPRIGPWDLVRERVVEVLVALGPAARPQLVEVAAGRRGASWSSWVAVIDVVGVDAAAPLAEALANPTCPPAFDDGDDLEEAAARLRLGRALPSDMPTIIEALASVGAGRNATRLLPLARWLRPSPADRAALAWLAAMHPDGHARPEIATFVRSLP